MIFLAPIWLILSPAQRHGADVMPVPAKRRRLPPLAGAFSVMLACGFLSQGAAAQSGIVRLTCSIFGNDQTMAVDTARRTVDGIPAILTDNTITFPCSNGSTGDQYRCVINRDTLTLSLIRDGTSFGSGACRRTARQL